MLKSGGPATPQRRGQEGVSGIAHAHIQVRPADAVGGYRSKIAHVTLLRRGVILICVVLFLPPSCLYFFVSPWNSDGGGFPILPKWERILGKRSRNDYDKLRVCAGRRAPKPIGRQSLVKPPTSPSLPDLSGPGSYSDFGQPLDFAGLPIKAQNISRVSS